jgi:hypothetical protein
MDYNKILKFIVLIIVILFFSYLNSRKAVEKEEEESKNKEGFTSNIREYFNKKRRDVRHKVEEFKTKTSNTVNKVYKKFNN